MESNRKLWLDNLRWFTVLLVLFYHVFYYYNNKGAFGGIGGFEDDPLKQPQDIVLYVLYPWLMMLLFLLAGISARYSLCCRTTGQFLRSRSQKLLIPTLLGPLVYHWIAGYFTIMGSPGAGSVSGMTAFFKWLLFSVVGASPLWFLQDLFLFSLLILAVRKLDAGEKFKMWCARATTPVILLMGTLIYAGSQCMIFNPDAEKPIDGIMNLYRPIAYLVPFLMGFFVFSNSSVLKKVKDIYVPLSVCAAIACVAFCITNWGKNYTSPQFLSGWLNCLYAWLMILAMMGVFMKFFDSKNAFCNYMTRTSFGLYVLHYAVMVSFGYLFKTCTAMSPWLIYPLLLLIVFILTPALHELIRHIPFIRWAVLGMKKQ